MKKIKDISNQKFNKLTAVSYWGNGKWLFKCDCGNEVIKVSGEVKRGNVTACSRKCSIKNISKHPLYKTWDGIKKRCCKINATGYNNYGGRGITICDEWKTSFDNFLKDMGEKPNECYSIDRIDNNKGYYKENCRWINKKEQANNRRNNLKINYNGKIYTFYDICKKLNIKKFSTVYYQYKKSNLNIQDYFDKYIIKYGNSN